MIKDFEIVQGDMEGAINIMLEVALWCENTGKNMWKQEELSKDRLLKGIAEKNFCIGRVENDNAATMILQWHDSVFWPEIEEDESGFIHKLCVRRRYSGNGLSKMMIDYAIAECKKKGVRYLRLDTGWDRDKLRHLYENLGFVKVGRKTVGVRDYALYELRIS